VECNTWRNRCFNGILIKFLEESVRLDDAHAAFLIRLGSLIKKRHHHIAAALQD